MVSSKYYSEDLVYHGPKIMKIRNCSEYMYGF